MVEYFQKRGFNTYTDSSRLFIYKVTRNLLQWTGDHGGYLRTAMKALVLFGVPPEIYWPYDVDHFDAEPSAFCYAFAQNYKAIKYFRHDPPGSKPEEVLVHVKTHLAAGLPTMFGFTVFSSIPEAGSGKNAILFPKEGDSMVGGHAVLAVGYDDEISMGEDTGALLIRNSWGPKWGDGGYGWLPYHYVLKGLAADFWSMVHADFVNLHIFE
jgi:C1A family cysteine protease